MTNNVLILYPGRFIFIESVGRTVDNYYIQMATILICYTITIMTNVSLLWATATENRWLILPWLFVYILVIFGIFCSAPMIIIWFVWLQPEPVWALLSLLSIALGAILVYFWHVVNSFFIDICNKSH